VIARSGWSRGCERHARKPPHRVTPAHCSTYIRQAWACRGTPPRQVDTRGGKQARRRIPGWRSSCVGARTAHPAPIPSRQAQNLPKALRRPPARPIPSGLHVSNRPGIEPGKGGQLLLGEPQPKPGGPYSYLEAVLFRSEPGTEGGFDGRPAPGEGLAFVLLPCRHRLQAAAQPMGKDSLRQAQVHPALADSLVERVRGKQITPWEYTRSAPTEAEVAEGQRNGASAAGSGIPNAAAAARRRRSHSIMRG